jgi:RNA polymerase sigma factor for flagellar operon FliA
MPQVREAFDVESQWRRYQTSRDVSLRNALIEHYRPLSKKIAASLYARRYSDDVEFEEYLQYAMVGLIESIDRYTLDRGTTFETYAKYRIRGAILNGLEKMSERREQYAYRARLLKERTHSITEGGSEKSEQSLFEEMVEAVLGLAICYMLEGTGLIRDGANSSVNQTYQAQEMLQLRERIVESAESLPEREKFIIQRHYFKQESFIRLSKIMGITKGRVSQLHKRAIGLLREKIIENNSLDGYY